MARLEGLEPPTFWFVAKHSNPTELQAQSLGYYITKKLFCQQVSLKRHYKIWSYSKVAKEHKKFNHFRLKPEDFVATESRYCG